MKFILYMVPVFSIILISTLLQSVFGTNTSPTLEDQFGHSTQTKLVHNDSILILNQTTQKLTYKMGENITLDTELINIGKKTVEIAYCKPWIALEIKDQTGNEVWPNSQLACIPEFLGKVTLQPGEHINVQPWVASMLPPSLHTSGNYTVVSVALFSFGVYNPNSVESLWSKPLQITILPEKVPEFPFAITIFLASITSLILFYRIKFQNHI